jgi:hypothetical protein
MYVCMGVCELTAFPLPPSSSASPHAPPPPCTCPSLTFCAICASHAPAIAEVAEEAELSADWKDPDRQPPVADRPAASCCSCRRGAEVHGTSNVASSVKPTGVCMGGDRAVGARVTHYLSPLFVPIRPLTSWSCRALRHALQPTHTCNNNVCQGSALMLTMTS